MCSGVDLVGQRRARVPRFRSTGPCLSCASAALCQGDNEIFNCVCEVELIAQVRVRDSLGLLALLFLPHPLAQGEGKEKVQWSAKLSAAEQKVQGVWTSFSKKPLICGTWYCKCIQMRVYRKIGIMTLQFSPVVA